jgi:hypothetical protein
MAGVLKFPQLVGNQWIEWIEWIEQEGTEETEMNRSKQRKRSWGAGWPRAGA